MGYLFDTILVFFEIYNFQTSLYIGVLPIWIVGPATRNLDAFPFEFVDAQGNVLAKSGLMGSGKVEEGDAVEIPEGAVALRIDTGQRIQGAPNTEPGGGT